MQIEDTAVLGARPDWLPRAIVSGFIASTVMLFTFVIAYGLGLVAADIQLADKRWADVFRGWFQGLVHNPVIDLTVNDLYAAVAVYFAVGLVWAALYAYFAEPRLEGPGWVRGVVFSLVPWLLSLVIFLPLVGGGPFGVALGAGPLPIIGNFILYMVYGATLGLIYSPFGDVVVDHREAEATAEETSMIAGSQAMAARGLALGLVVGLIVGVLGAMAAAAVQGGELLGLPPLAFAVASAIVGATMGGLIGSLAGLPEAGHV